jgi:putative Ca2+/H+ antiporter (TMEM165/GDT1 family)
MDKQLFATVFTSVFLAEVGDKTQLATLAFAADPKSSKLTVFAGSALALVLAAGIGVAAGEALSRVVSPRILTLLAGLAFIAIGVWTVAKAARGESA